jgi:hypothetical protein
MFYTKIWFLRNNSAFRFMELAWLLIFLQDVIFLLLLKVSSVLSQISAGFVTWG